MDSNVSVSSNKSQNNSPKSIIKIEESDNLETNTISDKASSMEVTETVGKYEGKRDSMETSNDIHILQLDTSETLDMYLDKNKNDKNQIEEVDSTKIDSSVEESKNDKILQLSCIDSLGNVQKSDDSSKSSKQEKGKVSQKDDSKLGRISGNFIWVYNISQSAKATSIKSYLSKFGKVVTAKIVTDGKTYYGYVVMDKSEDAQKCIDNLDNTYFEGKKIKLSFKGPDKINDSKKENRQSNERQLSTVRKEPRKARRSLTRKVRESSRDISESRRRERENLQEERRRRELESKLEEAQRKLDRERILFEKEKQEFLKLKKRLADNERMDIKKQKDILKKEARLLEEDLQKRKRSESLEFDRRQLDTERKHLKHYPSPPKRPIRYEEKKMHLPPPPPKICKEPPIDCKIKNRSPFGEKLKPTNEEHDFHHYNYKYPPQDQHRKQIEHRKEKLNESCFDEDKYKYNLVTNKKSESSPRYVNPAVPGYPGKNAPTTGWKPTPSGSLNHGFETNCAEHWKGSPSTMSAQSTQRFHAPFSEPNFGISFYHHPEYSRYGYHGPANSGKY